MNIVINGPNEETVNIANRILSTEIVDSVPLSQVKQLAQAVIQFQDATERLQTLVEQLQAANPEGGKK